MASVIAVGDLVQATGHAGPWKVLEIRQGLALLEHHAGHRLSVVRKGSPAQAVEPVAAEPESPTLFD